MSENNAAVKDFIDTQSSSAVNEEAIAKVEKEGIKLDLYVKHPLKNNVFLPVYIANFILMDYGTGAIYGVPAHDQRDFEFAKKYDLEIIQVIENNEKFNEVNMISALQSLFFSYLLYLLLTLYTF